MKTNRLFVVASLVEISDQIGVVYDKQLDALDSADPSSVVSGGSAVIHK